VNGPVAAVKRCGDETVMGGEEVTVNNGSRTATAHQETDHNEPMLSGSFCEQESGNDAKKRENETRVLFGVGRSDGGSLGQTGSGRRRNWRKQQ